MLKSYHAIHQWNHWLGQPLGAEVLRAEKTALSPWLQAFNGRHAVLIGVPKQYSLIENLPITDRLLLTPLVHSKHRCIETNWGELPISSGSIDLVLLPHTLEYANHPRQILSEACRIVKPEGKLVIFGFNPYSLWGMQHATLSQGHFISPGLIKQWLTLADFELVKQKSFLYRPPILQGRIFQYLKFFEWIGEKLHLPFGGIYMLIATAKVIPLTPIRLHWKQQLEGVKLTIPGPSVRTSL